MHAYEDQYMDTTDLILRSVCETDPADPDLKDTVCIGISDLKAILDLHLLATSKPEAKPAQPIQECYGDCPTDPKTCPNPCKFGGRHLADTKEHVQQYDQQALELCEACGWKTLIPDDGCLNCERKPLTDEQINQMWSDAHNDTSPMSLIHVLARAIEAAHGIKE